MLSPNAVKRVRDSVCDTRTRTEKPQAACFMSASDAVQCTVVSSIGNTLPDPGEHSTVYGAFPPVGDGESKWTSVPSSVVASSTIDCGQLI